MYNISRLSKRKIVINLTVPILYKSLKTGDIDISLRYERDLKIKNKYRLISSSYDKNMEKIFFVHKLGTLKSLGNGYEIQGIGTSLKKSSITFEGKVIEVDKIIENYSILDPNSIVLARNLKLTMIGI